MSRLDRPGAGGDTNGNEFNSASAKRKRYSSQYWPLGSASWNGAVSDLRRGLQAVRQSGDGPGVRHDRAGTVVPPSDGDARSSRVRRALDSGRGRIRRPASCLCHGGSRADAYRDPRRVVPGAPDSVGGTACDRVGSVRTPCRSALVSVYRTADQVFSAPRAQDGAGVELRRAFPGPQFDQIDPFLLLDEMGPIDFVPGDTRGFPPHPHRGFETGTYLLSGEMQHRDSWGNSGILRPGDVQWMTAGSGLVHSEMPAADLLRQGGRLHGFQLWVNLPRKDKMIAPRYQDTPSDRIPVVENDEGTVVVRVIAGESLGARGVIETRIPIQYLHVTAAPSAEFEQPVPGDLTALVYVIEGEGEFGGSPARAHQAVVLNRSGDIVRAVNQGSKLLSFLLIAGDPLGEPVARRGPFVMNTREEVLQAVEDFRSGRM